MLPVTETPAQNHARSRRRRGAIGRSSVVTSPGGASQTAGMALTTRIAVASTPPRPPAPRLQREVQRQRRRSFDGDAVHRCVPRRRLRPVGRLIRARARHVLGTDDRFSANDSRHRKSNRRHGARFDHRHWDCVALAGDEALGRFGHRVECDVQRVGEQPYHAAPEQRRHSGRRIGAAASGGCPNPNGVAHEASGCVP